ncbi:MAG: trehalose-phosphatase, partial [Synergistota bacterium]|nr:trehalose-phosphatase [Synergistota bacterium]
MSPMRNVPGDFPTRLERSLRPLLLLDYDGTLAPFTQERDKALPWEGVTESLVKIQRGVTDLVVVTGREAADIPRLLRLEEPFEVIGCHGAQMMQKNGKTTCPELPANMVAGLERAFSRAADYAAPQRLERKSAGLALHWRGVNPADAEKLKENTAVEWAVIAEESGLEVRPFDGGLELRVPGINKGAAVAKRLD